MNLGVIKKSRTPESPERPCCFHWPSPHQHDLSGRPTPSLAPWAPAQSNLTSLAPASRDRKATVVEILRTVKRSSVGNRYGCINRNDSKEGGFVQQTAAEKNRPEVPSQCRGWRAGGVWCCGRREGGAEAANVPGPGGAPGRDRKYVCSRRDPGRCYTHVAGVLQAITSRMTRIVRVGKE